MILILLCANAAGGCPLPCAKAFAGELVDCIVTMATCLFIQMRRCGLSRFALMGLHGAMIRIFGRLSGMFMDACSSLCDQVPRSQAREALVNPSTAGVA